MTFNKSFFIVLLLLVGACGKEGPLNYPDEKKRVRLDGYSDEMEKRVTLPKSQKKADNTTTSNK